MSDFLDEDIEAAQALLAAEFPAKVRPNTPTIGLTETIPSNITPPIDADREAAISALEAGLKNGTPQSTTETTHDGPDTTAIIESKSKKTRAEITSDIRLLEQQLCISEKSLKKATKPELLKYMAELLEQAGHVISTGLGTSIVSPVGSAAAKVEASIKADIKAKPLMTVAAGGDALHRINFILALALEQLSLSPINHTDCSLRGYADQIDRDKEVLRPIYERIYADYQKDIEPIVGPVSALALHMISTASITVVVNKKKHTENARQ